MKKQLNKRTKKTQRGGAASAARVSRPSGPSNGDGYTQADVDEFCVNITHGKNIRYPIGSEESGKLNSKFFEMRPGTTDARGLINVHIKKEWYNMIKNSKNSRGQTILYSALRSSRQYLWSHSDSDLPSVHPIIIGLLINIVNSEYTDAARKNAFNRTNNDGSLILHGLCNGISFEESRVNMNFICYIMEKIVAYGGNDALKLVNDRGETPLTVLDEKARRGLIDFAEFEHFA